MALGAGACTEAVPQLIKLTESRCPDGNYIAETGGEIITYRIDDRYILLQALGGIGHDSALPLFRRILEPLACIALPHRSHAHFRRRSFKS